MKHKIVVLLLTDTVFAALIFCWAYLKWNMTSNYSTLGIFLSVLIGPLFILINYNALFSLAIFSWPISICVILGYTLIIHSHAKFLMRCYTKNCLFYISYVALAWLVYAVTSLFVDYFAWYYCQ